MTAKSHALTSCPSWDRTRTLLIQSQRPASIPRRELALNHARTAPEASGRSHEKSHGFSHAQSLAWRGES